MHYAMSIETDYAILWIAVCKITQQFILFNNIAWLLVNIIILLFMIACLLYNVDTSLYYLFTFLLFTVYLHFTFCFHHFVFVVIFSMLALYLALLYVHNIIFDS